MKLLINWKREEKKIMNSINGQINMQKIFTKNLVIIYLSLEKYWLTIYIY